MDLEVVLLDHDVGPDEVEQLVLADRALAPVDQGEQHVDGTSTELRRLAVDLERARGAIDADLAHADFAAGILPGSAAEVGHRSVAQSRRAVR